MRRFYFGLFCLLAVPVDAQTIIGIKTGIDWSRFYKSDRSTQSKIGFNIGFSGEYLITKILSLRLEGLYVQKGSKIYEGSFNSESTYNLYKLHYVEIPISAKMSIPFKNEQLAIYAGIYSAGLISGDIFSVTAAGKENRIGSIKHFLDYGYQGGFNYGVLGGLELDLRYSFGLTSVIKRPVARQNKNLSIGILYQFYRI